MRGTECGTLRKIIKDAASFPFCKLEHRDLFALLLGASYENDHCWSQRISMSISKPPLLRYSNGIAVIALK
jgi:hypothetical protein